MPRSRDKFSLRTVLMEVTLLCVGLVWIAWGWDLPLQLVLLSVASLGAGIGLPIGYACTGKSKGAVWGASTGAFVSLSLMLPFLAYHLLEVLVGLFRN